jgi:hypothetical protein
MKKIYAIIMSVAMISSAFAATPSIGVSFGYGTTVPNGADGIETWTTTSGGSGSVTADGSDSTVTCTWSANGVWGWGPNSTDTEKIYAEHLEDAQPIIITLTGLDNWLSSLGALSYKVRLYRNTNESNGEFPPVYVTNTVNSTQVDVMDFVKFTDGNAFRSVTNSIAMTAPSISLTTSQEGTFGRAQTAAVALQATIPEPTFTLFGLVGLAFFARKK